MLLVGKTECSFPLTLTLSEQTPDHSLASHASVQPEEPATGDFVYNLANLQRSQETRGRQLSPRELTQSQTSVQSTNRGVKSGTGGAVSGFEFVECTMY